MDYLILLFFITFVFTTFAVNFSPVLMLFTEMIPRVEEEDEEGGGAPVLEVEVERADKIDAFGVPLSLVSLCVVFCMNL